ncbi:hypothetical protein GCM10007874_53290 [Labrys miyagiensis]|uniref:Uncharacterized protein n=1 Tax=Labrys miyagiensis TaxID=346912 RepID=A0ABQ6CVP0_9HYPH|nr:hypothetical protein GCM10007874_53290 [Labrys miyagiensis]
MHFADPVQPAGIEQDAFGKGGLAGIDMGHDADIADMSSHRFAPKGRAAASRCAGPKTKAA